MMMDGRFPRPDAEGGCDARSQSRGPMDMEKGDG